MIAHRVQEAVHFAQQPERINVTLRVAPTSMSPARCTASRRASVPQALDDQICRRPDVVVKDRHGYSCLRARARIENP
jgi:hypothetical protein